MQQHSLTIRALLAHLAISFPLRCWHLTLTISTLLALTLLPLADFLNLLLDFLILVLIPSTWQFITEIHIVVVISFIQSI